MSKGRNKELIERRDDALVRRYHYWTEVQRLRFDDALKQLSLNEFFISEERIISIVRRKARQTPNLDIRPPGRMKAPRITAAQLALFTGE